MGLFPSIHGNKLFLKGATIQGVRAFYLFLRTLCIDNSNLKSKFLNEWKSFRNDSNVHQYNLKQIQLKKDSNLLKGYFHLWSVKFITAKKLNKMNEIADKHFELIQLSKVKDIFIIYFLHSRKFLFQFICFFFTF